MIELFHPEPLSEEMSQAAQVVSANNVLARGIEVITFEEQLAQTVGSEYAIAVSNGSAALHLAVKAIGWKEGDKIITSPYSFIATSNSLLLERCEPIFGKINDGLQLDLDHVQEILEADSSIRGVIIPHIFGHEVNNVKIKEIKHNFPEVGIIEDASQAFADEAYGLGVGKYSDLATYSFHENKVISTFGEGGAVTTNNKTLADKVRSLREHGKLETPDWIDKIELGFNYRLTEVQASLGSLQLKRVESILDKRKSIAELMKADLSSEELVLPTDVVRSWFGFYVVIDTSNRASDIVDLLAKSEIQSRATPMPALTDFALNKEFIQYQNVSDLAKRVLLLPLHTRISDRDAEYISNEVKIALSNTYKAKLISSSDFYDKLANNFSEVRNERTYYINAIDQLVIETIRNYDLENGKIIDIGGGDGKRGRIIADAVKSELTILDNSIEMVKAASVTEEDVILGDISNDINEQGVQCDFNAALMLWNVLGHIDSTKRVEALKNVYEILTDNGLIFIDVNNLYNAKEYGEENVIRNRQAASSSSYESIQGDFVATKSVGDSTYSTLTHIFNKQEVVSLLHEAGFKIIDTKFIDYSSGEVTNEDGGQIFIVAAKGTNL